MNRVVLALFCLAATARVASAQTPTPATFYPLPVQNGSFITTLRNYLLGEDQSRDATWESDYKFGDPDGCRHSTAAGTTGTFTVPCTVMIDGIYVLDPATSITYATFSAAPTNTCWVIVTPQTNTAEPGFTRLPGTHYMGQCGGSASPRPTLSGPGIFVMRTHISAGGAIDQVVDLTSLSGAVNTYTNTSEIVAREDALWRGPTDGSSVQTYCFADGLGQCNVIPSGDSSGCAICGDAATNFFTTGALNTNIGGTGWNSAAETGVVVIGPTPGAWNAQAQLDPSLGGTGLDTSAVSNSVTRPGPTPGVWINQTLPTKLLHSPAADWGVDGTQCTKDDTNIFFAANIPGYVVACADNASGRFGALVRLPDFYSANSTIAVHLASTNTGSTAGVVGFDFTCVCVSDGETLSASNFASDVNLDTTYTGTTGEFETTTATIVCGGTCAAEDELFFRATVDTSTTTHSAPTEIKFGELVIEVQNSALSN